tara:strand:+ start:1630 stop:2481 length:852 start_codon:yes stop_codon:yes gene_type:complete
MFFSSLSFGGMARVRGLGGKPRNLIKDVFLNLSHNGAVLDETVSNYTWNSTSVITVTGEAGGLADVRIEVGGNNGYVRGNILMSPGDQFTYRPNGDWAALLAGNQQGGSTENYAPTMIALAAQNGRTTCYGGGNAGFPTGGQGSGTPQSLNNQFPVWIGTAGGGGGGQTTGYLSGSGGIRGAYYSGPGGTPQNGGFMQAGQGGGMWFGTGGAPGGFGYYGGGGGGGGWGPSRGTACPGGGGGGSNYAGGLPSGSPVGSIPLTSVSSGAGGISTNMRIISMTLL